eukprot:gnl/Dysnectes_brevis/1129_a1261_1701.p1 GENE.gnl/Dysnectes_brevis/1129_a1261_1701~~gnl/Dysnectes_brevis/1129_a1261_1701.p1  ORF type:complete len:475 (+),score=130.63 gnl/Dysnectes_brevis/1129_a1261_1701:714-2138(+)
MSSKLEHLRQLIMDLHSKSHRETNVVLRSPIISWIPLILNFSITMFYRTPFSSGFSAVTDSIHDSIHDSISLLQSNPKWKDLVSTLLSFNRSFVSYEGDAVSPDPIIACQLPAMAKGWYKDLKKVMPKYLVKEISKQVLTNPHTDLEYSSFQLIALLQAPAEADILPAIALALQQAKMAHIPCIAIKAGINATVDLEAHGFETLGPHLLALWPEQLPEQGVLDAALAQTDFAPRADRTGCLHRYYMPDVEVLRQQAANFVAYSFEDDPMFCITIPDYRRRMQMLMKTTETASRQAIRHAGLWVLIPAGNSPGQPSAALVMAQPGWYKHLVHTSFGMFMTMFAPGITLNAMTVLEEVTKHHSTVAPDPHVYVYLVCASPQLRGRGVGSIFLDGLRVMCDRPENRLPLYLENSNVRNLGFYHGKHSLQVHRVVRIVRKSRRMGEVPCYVMLRQPGAGAEVPLEIEGMVDQAVVLKD